MAKIKAWLLPALVILLGFVTLLLGIINHYQDETGCGVLGDRVPGDIYGLDGDVYLGPGDALCMGLDHVPSVAAKNSEAPKAAAATVENKEPVWRFRAATYLPDTTNIGASKGAKSDAAPTLPAPMRSVPDAIKCPIDGGYTLRINGQKFPGDVHREPVAAKGTYQCFVRFVMPRPSDAATVEAQQVRMIWGGRVAEGFDRAAWPWNWGTTTAGMEVCNKDDICSGLNKAGLRVFFPWMSFFGLLFSLITFFWLACVIKKHQLLRDSPGGSYSLAATQFTFWAVVIVTGFVLIFLFTGQVNGVLNTSILGLLGIYTATSYVATPKDKNLGQVDKNSEDAKQANFKAVRGEHENFWRDILTDPVFVDGAKDNEKTNIAPQRLMTVIWSIVIAMVILQSILFSFSFPDLDATMLGLSGVTSGAYAWFKKLKIKG